MSKIKQKIIHNYNQASCYIKRYGMLNAIGKLSIKCYSKITGSQKAKYAQEKARYQLWIKNNEPTADELEEQKKEKFKINPKISLLVPMYNTPVNFFEELVDCLIEQTYSNWELCLADGSSKKSEELEKIYTKDKRIKYIFLNENKGISGNTNEALKLATGDYIALFDHDDLLPPFCMYEIVKCINKNPDVEFIYTDEDKIIDTKQSRYDPHFKSDFAPDTLRANNYITHLSIFKKELMDKLGGFRDEFNGAQDYDIILRASENTDKIIHIPKVLYHWRVHPNSTASLASSKPYAYDAGVRVIQEHLKRVGLNGKAKFGGDIPGVYEVQYDVIGHPKVSIIIPNKDGIKMLETCVNSIISKTTYDNYEIVIVENNSQDKETFKFYEKLEKNPKIRVIKYPNKGFNYSAIINFGVKNCDSEFVMQLNNDTQLITPNWLEKFIGYAQRKDVGAVGARLYYADKSIQHAGMALGIGGLVANLYTKTKHGLHAYYGHECLTANVSGVTGACLFSRREIYDEVGYMEEEKFKVAFNDADFCLKIRQKGYLIVYNPYIELMHYESKTRGYEDTPQKKERFAGECQRFKEKWADALKAGDPYYNINFSRDTDQCNVRTDKVDYTK